MKDINGQLLKEGNAIIFKAGNKNYNGVITKLTEDVAHFAIDGKKAHLTSDLVEKHIKQIQLLEEETYDVKPMLKEMLSNTKPTYIIEEDAFQDISLDTLRINGIGVDKDASMGINEDSARIKRYGKMYQLLKEVYDISMESEETDELAEIVSKIANEIKKQM